MEVWRDIVGYEGLYQVSNLGRVKSFKSNPSGRILSIKNSNGWYLSTILVLNGVRKTHRIHQLVAEHFIPKKEYCTEINHKDMNKQNNTVDNLEWVTRYENMKYASILKPSFLKAMKQRNQFDSPKRIQQYDLDGNFIAEYANSTIASNLTGVCGRNILQVASKDEYKPGMTRSQAGGFIWKYKE